MKKLIIGSMALALSFTAVACGSDDSSSSDTTTASATDDTSTADTAATDGGSVVLGEKQQAVLDQTLGQVSAAGLVADEACMSALIAGLTDEDADLILAAGPTDTVTASPEGEAIGQQLVNCVSDPTTATT